MCFYSRERGEGEEGGGGGGDNLVRVKLADCSFLKEEAAAEGRDRSAAICRAQPSKSFLCVKCGGEIRWRQARGEIGSCGRQRGSETKS